MDSAPNMVQTAPPFYWLMHWNTPKKPTQHVLSPPGTSAEHSTALVNQPYKWHGPAWVSPLNGPHSSSNSTSKAPLQYGSRSHNSPTTKLVKQACPTFKPSEQQTSYSQPNEASPKVMSPAHSDRMQSMTYFSEPSPSNVAITRIPRHKRSPTPMTSSPSAAPSPVYSNKLTW